MKIIEIITSIIFLIGIIFKIFNWPGNHVFVVTSLTILSYYYFLFGFAIFNNIKTKNIFKNTSYKNISPLHIIFSVLLGMSLSVLVNGIMFYIQNWSPENDLFFIGQSSVFIILILYLIFFKKQIQNFKSIFLRSLIIIVLGIIIYSTL